MKKEVSIADRVREITARRTSTVMQEIGPVRESINKDMVQCNFDIHPDLKKQLKLRALEEEQSIKEIITAAIHNYLSR